MKKMGAKAVVVALAGVLAIGGAVGGTLAWLTDETDTVTNTFTAGDIGITLTETSDGSFTIIPGGKDKKDPVVKVTGDSEKCYLFVEVLEKNNDITDATAEPMKYVTWDFNDPDTQNGNSWALLPNSENRVIYWRVVESSSSEQFFYLLTGTGDGEYKNGAVSYSPDLTKGMLKAIKTGEEPSLAFTAYAIQYDYIDSELADDATDVQKAQNAWKLVGSK